MSRTQWCCLTALLAVVMGLLLRGPAGPASSAAAASERGAVAEVPVVTAAEAVTVTAVDAAATEAAAVAVDAVGMEAAVVTVDAAATEAAAIVVDVAAAATRSGVRDPGVPGCGKPGDHDGEPAVPARARAGHDQAPGLAPWGLPAATGALSAEPPPGIRVRAPVPATPTPVELSVLRV